VFVTPHHLLMDPAKRTVECELAVFFRSGDGREQAKQRVSEFLFGMRAIAALDCVHEFPALLEQEPGEARSRLLSVPRDCGGTRPGRVRP